MAKLPFAIEPRLKPVVEIIGNEDIGAFKIERRGYLTAAEKNFFQQIVSRDSSTSELIGVARKAARKFNLELSIAYESVMAVLGGAINSEVEEKIEEEFSDELSSVLINLTNARVREQFAMAACILVHRVSNEFNLSEIGELNPVLIEELAKFYQEEDEKSIEKLRKPKGAKGKKVEAEEEEKVDILEIEKKQMETEVNG